MSFVRTTNVTAPAIIFMALTLHVNRSTAEDAQPTLAAASSWRCVLEGEQIKFPVRVSSGGEALEGELVWVLRANRRVLQQGEAEVQLDADMSVTLDAEFKSPELAEGVVLEASLELSLQNRAGRELTRQAFPIHIFAYDPFFRRTQWLKNLKLTLFDPPRETAALLDAEDIPFQLIRSVDALVASRPSVVVIGEGVSLSRHRGLASAARELAQAGSMVLVLAPADGDFPIVRSDDADRLSEIHLHRREVLLNLDKRFDTSSWKGEKPVAAGLKLTSKAEDVVGVVEPPDKGWPWVEIVFAKSDNQNDGSRDSSRLIVCGFGIVKQWEQGPVPRYLFARLLERLEPPPNSSNLDSTSEDRR